MGKISKSASGGTSRLVGVLITKGVGLEQWSEVGSDPKSPDSSLQNRGDKDRSQIRRTRDWGSLRNWSDVCGPPDAGHFRLT